MTWLKTNTGFKFHHAQEDSVLFFKCLFVHFACREHALLVQSQLKNIFKQINFRICGKMVQQDAFYHSNGTQIISFFYVWDLHFFKIWIYLKILHISSH